MKSHLSATFAFLVLPVVLASSGRAAEPPAADPGMVTVWVRVADEGATFTLDTPQLVRYGDGGLKWAPMKTLTGTHPCSYTFFGDPAPWMPKFCEVRRTVPGVVQVPGQMPVVNKALMPPPIAGYAEPRARPLTPDEKVPGSVWLSVPADIGAFRVPCGSYARVSNDDPIVFPGKPGASHLHTFVGNVAADAYSTPDSLMNKGGSTCAGGTLNRTAYWMPSMIDTRTGQPILPTSTNFYYKQGYLSVKAEDIQPFPKGLRMIAGDSSATKPINSLSRFACDTTHSGWQLSIPPCPAGGDLIVNVTFPQCWDGKNLDSPDHKSHMAYGIAGKGCPADHPVPLPEISQNVHYTPSESYGTATWRLSSDKYIGPAGYSLHADWYGAWDPATMKTFIDHCIRQKMDCHDDLLGDGSTLY
jgi:hypothetical protein